MTKPRDKSEPGNQLIIHLIDDYAASDPNRTFAKIPCGPRLEDGYRTVTMGQLSNAINQAAWWLRKQFPDSRPRTIGYMGPQDFRYIFLALGGVKSGIEIFFPSMGNTKDVNISLLETYDCSNFLFAESADVKRMMKSVLEERPMQCFDVPGLDYFLEIKVPHFEWICDLEEGKYKVIAAMQTSGTTGMPKTVRITHGMLTAAHALKRFKGEDSTLAVRFSGMTVLVAAPFFHGSGLIFSILAVYLDFVVVVLPSGSLAANVVAGLINTMGVDAAILPPYVLAAMAADPALIMSLSKVKHVYFGGGPLPTEVGNKIAQLTHLSTGWGGSEIGMFDIHPGEREDWSWLHFPDVYGIEWRRFDGDEYEMVVVRNGDLKDYQSVFTLFPDIQEWATKDLFVQHPIKKGLWKFRGRKDDIIVYASGLKLNPSSMEDAISGNPTVKAALVCGTGRFKSALLVEPAVYPAYNASKTKDDLIELIWPLVQKSNETIDSQAQIEKDMILVASEDKPLPRAGKGTVQRRAAVSLYATELDQLYLTNNQIAMPIVK